MEIVGLLCFGMQNTSGLVMKKRKKSLFPSFSSWAIHLMIIEIVVCVPSNIMNQ
jgi:hypothetical protein